MTSNLNNSMNTLLLIILHHSLPISGKILDGSIWQPKSDFVFLTRFCFQSGDDSAMRYEIRYPRGYCTRDQNGIYENGCQKLVLYYDEKDQWDYVYKNKKLSCEEKLSPDLLKPSQIINLDPLREHSEEKDSAYRYSLHVSGCYYEHGPDSNVSDIMCVAERYFQSIRDRWWFVALVNCESDKGVKLSDYHFEFTNGHSYNRHFSADEWYIMEMNVLFFLLFSTLLVLSIVCAGKLRKLGFHHGTFKLFSFSLIFKLFSTAVYLGVYIRYQQGFEEEDGKKFAMAFSIVSEVMLVLLILLLSQGYTITRAKLRNVGTVKTLVFMCIFSVVYFAAFLHHCYRFDPGEVLYFYESPPGYCVLANRVLTWAMMSYSVFFTVKHYPEKMKFYLRFYIFYSCWILLTPVLAVFSIFVLEDHYRQKVVFGIETALSLCSFAYFLFLTRPTTANENFPFHIKTTQIAVLEATDTGNIPHDIRSDDSFSASSAITTETNFADLFRVDYSPRSENDQ